MLSSRNTQEDPPSYTLTKKQGIPNRPLRYARNQNNHLLKDEQDGNAIILEPIIFEEEWVFKSCLKLIQFYNLF